MLFIKAFRQNGRTLLMYHI